MGEIEAEHLRLSYNIIQRMYSKIDDPEFWAAFKPKDLTAGIRAVNELILAIAKPRPEGYKTDVVEHDPPLSAEEQARVDELFRQITSIEEEEEEE